MANLTLKHLLDHGVDDAEWLDAHSAVASNPVYMIYAYTCRLAARVILALACLPLLTIRRMPQPLHTVCAREFYYLQWLDDLHHIRSAHYKVMFALARVIDSIRLAAEYGTILHNPATPQADPNTSKANCRCRQDANKNNRTI